MVNAPEIRCAAFGCDSYDVGPRIVVPTPSNPQRPLVLMVRVCEMHAEMMR